MLEVFEIMKFSKSQMHRLVLYGGSILMVLLLLVGIRHLKGTIGEQYNHVRNRYSNTRWELVKNAINTDIIIAKEHTSEAARNIQFRVNYGNELHMDILKDSFEKRFHYDNFEKILREELSSNIFTTAPLSMDKNKNSIFVMVNGYILANYSHNIEFLSLIDDSIDFGTPLRESIKQIAYNQELCSAAICTIENQGTIDGLIVWQKDKPVNTEPVSVSEKQTLRKSITWPVLENIFREHGLEGYDSYELLVPAYITEHGNIFGDFDTSKTAGKFNNKIIIVQRVDLKESLQKLIGTALSNLDIEEVDNRYNSIMRTVANIELLLYIGIIMFIVLTVNAMNRVIEEAMRDECKDCATKN